MVLEVYWTRFAEYKLDDVFIYHESKAGECIAKKLINGIINHTIGLENHPKIGQRELLLKKYTQNFRYLRIIK